MVERSLSMREVPGSMPGSSSYYTPTESIVHVPVRISINACQDGRAVKGARLKSTVSSFDYKGAFWSTNVGVGSNPTSDMDFRTVVTNSESLTLNNTPVKIVHRAGFEPAT